MTAFVAALAAAGVLLVVSPLLWPARTSQATSRRPTTAGLRDRLAQAGLSRVSTPVFVAVSVVVGAAASALCFALVPVAPLAAVALALGASSPTVAVTWRARARRRANRAAWPDLVDHLLGGIRSGVALPDALASLAEVGPDELRHAFAAFRSDYAATAAFGSALDRLKERIADPVADRIIETLRVSREVGGTELPALLRTLSSSLRLDQAVRSEVEARQSWIVNAARLGVAAPWIVLIMLSARPEAAAAFNSPSGVALIAIGAVVTAFAYRLMIALGRLPEERRWLA